MPALPRYRVVDLAIRMALSALGIAAIAWAVAVLPVAWPRERLTRIAAQVIAGEVYPTAIFAGIDADLERWPQLAQNSLATRAIAIVRLREAELALRAGDRERIAPELETLHESLIRALANVPGDPFLWLAFFWAENTRSGYVPDNLRWLRMSYQSGPNEGWVAAQRDRFALAIYPFLPPDLAALAVADFAGLVRSRFYQEAADLAAGPGASIRDVLLAQLTFLDDRQRSYFANILRSRSIEDLSALGLTPPQSPWR